MWIQVARETAARLQLKGDSEGHVVWGRVADAIERRFPKSLSVESVETVTPQS